MSNKLKLYSVTVLRQHETKVGYRTRIIGANSKDEAVGAMMRMYQEKEPDATWSSPGVIAITKELLEEMEIEL